MAAPAAARTPQQALTPLAGGLCQGVKYQGPRCQGWGCHILSLTTSLGGVEPKHLDCREPVEHRYPGAGDMVQCL